VIAGEVLNDATSVVIALVALAALMQQRVKVPEPALVAVAALAGLALFS
jgi:NhaP-type Na+/H+ or K+/H+ antiporter